MPEPQTHYFEVEMRLQDFKDKFIDVKMPVWAPGSYLVREFPKNVEGFTATAGNKNLKAEKINKNTWRVYADKNRDVLVKYKVYAFELTVRTSFVDEMHAYLNGTSVFMYPAKYKQLPSELTIEPYGNWNQISTSLPTVGGNKWKLRADNYDILADSPIEIGTHKILTFEAAGVPHEVAMFGESNYDDAKIVADMKKIVEECTRVFGEHPVKGKYVFIIHNVLSGGGGLEHLNSTTLQVARWGYQPENSYNGFLALVAHEYFHLWNVKRLRPEPLGPFNYDAENYTTLLWVSEGLTSYYDDLLVRRAGFYSPERYLDVMGSSITNVENTPGVKVQTLSESSFDAWIKSYRPNENSRNAEISYYSKGALIGMLLDLEIMNQTKGEKDLDQVFRNMYQKYYKKLNRGFTEKEFKEELEKVAGIKFDTFFRDYVNGTVTPDYNKYLNYAGLRLTNLNANNQDAALGANTSNRDGKIVVTSVVRDGSAWKGGLNVNDEIIALNGYRITDDLNKSIAGRQPGDQLNLIVNRDGRLLSLDLTLEKNPNARYRIEKLPEQTPAQQTIYRKWLRLS
ncbi:M61 family metallopeptidase [Adhaeribacter soli]|uniref:M61 family metallopeptidase n=2 Tax=Adhaeribacter soli TaxID=2607655 RepID=A0A5N1J7W3_9BACT|nr:M61 family metallopeptidase [Adhaeribacter soli]